MERLPQPPNQLLAEMAESTFATVGLAFVGAVGRLVSTAWGVTGLFVSEADLDDPLMGRIFVVPAPEDRRAEWSTARGESWFPRGSGAKYYSARYVSGEHAKDHVLDSHSARTILSIRLDSRRTPHSEYVGFIDSDEWSAEQEASAEALLRLIAPRIASELERERLAHSADVGERAFHHVVDSCQEAVLVWSGRSPGTLEYVNNAALNLLGRTEPQLHADPAPLLSTLTSLPRSDDSDELTYWGDVEIQRPDGANIMVSAHVLVADPAIARPSTHVGVLHPASDVERAAVAPSTASVPSQLQVAEGARVGMMIVNDGAVTLMNKIASDIFGTANRDEIARRPVTVRSSDHDAEMVFRDFLRQLARHRYAHRLISIEGKRGTERIIEVRGNSTSVAGTNRLIILLTDVSAREQRTAAIEERVEAQRSILDALPLALLAVGRDGTVMWSNSRFVDPDRKSAEGLGAALDLAAGANLVEACRRAMDAGIPGARELALGVGSVLNGSLPTYTTEYETALMEGERVVRSFAAFVTPLANRGGAILCVAETSAMTQRERAAKDESAQTRALLENLPEQVARLGLNGDVLQVIGPARRAPSVALLPNGTFKRNVRDVLPAEEAQQLLQAAQEASESNSLLVTMLHIVQQDRERQYEVRVLPMDSDVIVTLLDRTAEQRAHTKLNGDGEDISPRLRRRNPYDLTFREASVLELMSNAASDKEIASQLGVSVFTVNKHVSKILHKMGAVSRTEASIRAIRESLITR